MPLVRMVRHGEAAARYDEHPDPGLSERGRQQASAVADQLAPRGPLAIVSSPMARARETAAPLAASWSSSVEIAEAVSEIPSPGLGPAQRGLWLQRITGGTWDESPLPVRQWCDEVVAAVLALEADAVVFSHFVAINALISVAVGATGPYVRQLDHCSVTTFDTSGRALRLVESGSEGVTAIL